MYEDLLFLLTTRSFRPLLGFSAMSSSSSELESTWVITSLGELATEDVSSSTLESESSTGLSIASLSFSKRNRSISASRDRSEEAVSSLGATTSQGERCNGSSIGGRSP